MRVAVLGAGAAAFALAVFLKQQGHAPVVWSPSGRSTRTLATNPSLQATGAIEGAFEIEVADTCAEALKGAEGAIVALPAMGHRTVFDAMAPHLREGQFVIISSHCSFGGLYLDRTLRGRGVTLPIIAWSTTLLRSRRTGDKNVRIATVRKRIDMAVLPSARNQDGLEICQALFGDRFNLRDDLLAISLSNLNPQSHMALALCNFTRMELGEAWDQAACSTEGVDRIVQVLDRERGEIASRFDVIVRSIDEHRAQTHGSASKKPAVATMGPATIETRYVLEDVPFGLVTMVELARIAGIQARFHEFGIEVFSALYQRDFRVENDLLPAIGLSDLSRDALRDLCRAGHR